MDFFDPDAISAKVEEVLDDPDKHLAVRQAARQTVLDKHDLNYTLPEHVAWLESFL